MPANPTYPQASDTASLRAGDDDAATLLTIGRAIAARWKLVVAIAILCATLAAAWSLVAQPRYRSTLQFALDEQSALPSLGGLAALAGPLSLGAAGVRSLDFHASVLTGPDLLASLAVDSFPLPGETERRLPLYLILGFDDPDTARALADAREHLQKKVLATSTNTQTGTITLDVSLPDPELAAQVASRMFDLLGQFNVETRRSEATERRRFTERELARARQELASAEAELRSFLEANRDGLESPRLAVRRQQIQRRVSVLEQVFSELSREAQSARIDEVRDTPVFTLVQTPRAPVYREYPKRTRMTLIGGLLGGTLTVMWIAIATSMARGRRSDWAQGESV